MKFFTITMTFLLVMPTLPATAQTDYVPANIQLHENIESTLIHLRKTKAERYAAEDDLILSQRELTAVEARMHTPQEQTILMDRIQKDRLGSWTFLQDIFKDLGYLQSQRGFLTPEERATVDEITRQLTQGT